MVLEASIRAAASALGFDACGFAAAAPLERGAFFDGWLAAGFAGEMRWLERRPDRRLTLAGILADARSVITLAYPYAPPPLARVDWRTELRGRVAAYAIGSDYHRVVERALRALQAEIATLAPGSATRRYVDTGAVLEREWAVRGGLGWFGKNTMLLSTRRGSWFFLAELVTTLALRPDPPTGSHCGRCTACLDACPTNALGEGLVMDARRCISYLTIEHRSALPASLRPALGPWIFGCDVCQEVCPWNPTPAATLAADDPYWPSLPALLALDDAAFRARFGDTPLVRTRRRGLLRNVAVVLGNTGNPAAVPPLAAALDDPEPLVRGHAAWALGRLGGREAGVALTQRGRREGDPGVQEEIRAADAALRAR